VALYNIRVIEGDLPGNGSGTSGSERSAVRQKSLGTGVVRKTLGTGVVKKTLSSWVGQSSWIEDMGQRS
jgi:hypothetical protein